MEVSSSNKQPIQGSLVEAALSGLGYPCRSSASAGDTPSSSATQECLLETLLDRFELPTELRLAIRRIVQSGFTLRATCRNPADAWLGVRLYFGHQALFSPTTRFSSLICSRLGRNYQHLPHWPHLLDRVLQDVHRRGDAVLNVPGTTLAKPIAEFAQRANLRCWTVSLAAADEHINHWLGRLISGLGSVRRSRHSNAPTALNISRSAVASGAEKASSRNEKSRPLFENFEQLKTEMYISPPLQLDAAYPEPLRDAVSFSIADRVYCLHVRSGGNLDRLLNRRLQEDHFRADATRVVLTSSNRQQPPVRQESSMTKWLDRGAVGWLVNVADENGARNHRSESACTQPHLSVALRQLSCPLHLLDTRNFVVHATRGNLKLHPHASNSTCSQKLWTEGSARFLTAVEVLDQICKQARIESSAKWNRTETECVSFADVALSQLLSRRTFRSHLGRWDWEPYGILVDRQALKSLGARPVIYGDDALYQTLSASDRPFFQPAGRDRQWCEEREWRLPGRLRLDLLPACSIRVFVQHKCQAQQFAKRYPWPVCWVERAGVDH